MKLFHSVGSFDEFLFKLKRRVNNILIARSVIRVNPLFRFFSRQLRLKRTKLNSNHSVLVIGVNGDIGKAVVNQLINQGCNVFATYREQVPEGLESNTKGNLTLLRLDITDYHKVNEMAGYFKANNLHFDVILIATGYSSKFDCHSSLLAESQETPELDEEYKELVKSLEINTIGPYFIIRKFSVFLKTAYVDTNIIPQLCILTSSLGTMYSEIYGGMYSYRTAKGALHAVSMPIYCDLRQSGLVGFNFIGPGNVKTKMNDYGIISAEEAASEIINNIEYSLKKASFQFIGIGGKRIPW